jgi:hypothetical protein
MDGNEGPFSGCDFPVEIVGLDGPPVRYSVAAPWPDDGEGMSVGHLTGLDTRGAFASLPGLAGKRQAWLRGPQENLLDARSIASSASVLLLWRFAAAAGVEPPFYGGSHPKTTLVAWLDGRGMTSLAAPILAHAGLTGTEIFLDVWERLALASANYPRATWGVCPRVTRVEMCRRDRRLDYRADRVPLDAEQRKRVESLLTRWAAGETVRCAELHDALG